MHFAFYETLALKKQQKVVCVCQDAYREGTFLSKGSLAGTIRIKSEVNSWGCQDCCLEHVLNFPTINCHYCKTDFQVRCVWYTGSERLHRAGFSWLCCCLVIITFTEMFLVKCLRHWKRRKAGLPQPPHVQTSQSRCGSGLPVLRCIPQPHSPCRKRWRLLTVVILSLRGPVSLSSFKTQIFSCCKLLETLWLSQNNSSLHEVKTEMSFHTIHKRKIKLRSTACQVADT